MISIDQIGIGGPVPYSKGSAPDFDVDDLSQREQSIVLRVLLRESRAEREFRNEQTRMVVNAICEKIVQRSAVREVRVVVPHHSRALSLIACVAIMLAVLALAAFALYCGYGFLAFLFGVVGVVFCAWGLCICERGVGA